MIIRDMRPDIWARPELAGLTDFYEGPPTPIRDVGILCMAGRRTQYVYAFFSGRELLYVGRSRSIWARFSKHQARDWWPLADHVEILRLDGDDGCDPWTVEQAIKHAEQTIIYELEPRVNVAGVPRRRCHNCGAYQDR